MELKAWTGATLRGASLRYLGRSAQVCAAGVDQRPGDDTSAACEQEHPAQPGGSALAAEDGGDTAPFIRSGNFLRSEHGHSESGWGYSEQVRYLPDGRGQQVFDRHGFRSADRAYRRWD